MIMQWLVRGIAASLCMVAAILSARDAMIEYWINQTVESYMRGHAPVDVPGWIAASPRVRGVSIQWVLWTGTPKANEMPGIAANAKAVLRADPLESTALYQLGMVAENRRAGAGEHFFDLAERVSRHEVANELELEGLAAGRADNAAAIAHIDRAAVTAPDLADKLLAPLVPAIADPAVLTIFTHYADRPWFKDLIWQAIKDGGDPDAIERLIRAGSRHWTVPQTYQLSANLIAVLVAQGDFDAAHRVFSGLAPGVRAGLENIGFSAVSTDPSLAPLSWRMPGNDTASARFDGERGLSIVVSPDQATQVATRVTLLAPGTYVLSQTLIHEPSAAMASIVWDMLCLGENQTVAWHQPATSNTMGSSTSRTTITIPDACRAQAWNLQAVGAPGDMPSAVLLTNLGVHRQ